MATLPWLKQRKEENRKRKARKAKRRAKAKKRHSFDYGHKQDENCYLPDRITIEQEKLALKRANGDCSGNDETYYEYD